MQSWATEGDGHSYEERREKEPNYGLTPFTRWAI